MSVRGVKGELMPVNMPALFRSKIKKNQYLEKDKSVLLFQAFILLTNGGVV